MVDPFTLAVIGAGTGLVGGVLAKRDATRNRRRQRAAILQADRLAEERVRKLLGKGTIFQSAKKFLRSAFSEEGNTVLEADFGKAIQAAQASRGLFSGNLGAVQEAQGRSAFAQRLKQSLLPSVLQFAEAPEKLRQSIAGFETPRLIAAATGGQLTTPFGSAGPGNVGSAGVFNSALQGALGGFNLGQGLQQSDQFNQALDALRQSRQEKQSATGKAVGSPLIDSQQAQILQLLGGFGGGGQGVQQNPFTDPFANGGGF